MERLIAIAGIIALTLCVPCPAQPAAEAPAAPNAATAVIREFDAAQDALEKSMEAARTDAEREALRARHHRLVTEYSQRLLKLADGAPTAAPARDALVWIAQNNEGQHAESLRDALTRLVAFAADPTIIDMAPSLEDRNVAHVEPLLVAIADRHPKPATRGVALLTLGRNLRNRAREASGAESEALTKRAEKAFEDALRQYPTVPARDGQNPNATVGDVVPAELFEIRNLAIGKEAPDIVGDDMDGKPMRLSDYRGKVVVLDFFGDWCVNCVAMFPDERALVARLKGKPFALLGIVNDESKAPIAKRIERGEVTWPCWFDAGFRGPINRRWNVRSWPTVYVLDQNGVIRYRDVRGKDLDAAVDQLFREAAKPDPAPRTP